MFLGTLKTLILAGKETLQEILGVPVTRLLSDLTSSLSA